jgi:hypothetical protein
VFFVSVASKGFSQAVSLLFATLAGTCISVADKVLRGGKVEIAENAELAGTRGGMASQQGDPPPHPGWFFAKSVETIENKRVEFLPGAKEFASV